MSPAPDHAAGVLSETCVAALINGAPIGMVACCKDGAVRSWNRAFAETAGGSISLPPRWNLLDLLPPAHCERVRQRLRFPAPGDGTTLETFMKRADGTEVPILLGFTELASDLTGVYITDLRPQRSLEGAVQQSEARYRLVTERKEALDALAAVTWTLEQHLSSTPLAVVEYTPDFRVRRWSGGAETLFGWTAAEIVGCSISEIGWVPPDELVNVNRFVADVTAGRPTAAVVCGRNQSKDGRTLSIEWYHSILRDQAGNVQSVLCLGLDVTRTREILNALERSEAQFRQLADGLPQLVWTATPAGAVDYCNVRWTEDTATRVDALMENDWTQVLHPDDVEFCTSLWQHSIRSGSEFTAEYRLHSIRNGEYRWHLARAVPIRNGAGDITKWIGTCTDIQDQKTAEQTLRRSQAQLEELIIARTAELHDQKNAAEQASRAKTEFLASMSHELRTPLNAIIGFSELMHDELLGPVTLDQKLALKDVLSSSRHLLQLIGNVLDLAKIESGKMQPNADQVDVAECITQAVRLLSPLAAQKQLSVTVEIAPGRWRTDPMMLKQILYNYLSNAIKFTPGERKIAVRGYFDAGRFVLEVTDSGPGIAAADLSKLFKPFEQVSTGISRAFGGTGLGLALVKHFADLQGGTVGVKTAPGRGSSFSVRLPAARLAEPEENAA